LSKEHIAPNPPIGDILQKSIIIWAWNNNGLSLRLKFCYRTTPGTQLRCAEAYESQHVTWRGTSFGML
jgi:hypothetical protein